MKYDDASWHYGGDFPEELPPEAGATHIGMFVAWGMLNGLAGDLYRVDLSVELDVLKKRQVTPGQFLMEACDEKFVDAEFNDEGNAFALAYYGGDDGLGQYLEDYAEAVGADEERLYYVEDSWETYDKVAVVVNKRFHEWKDDKTTSFADKDFSLNDIVDKKPWWKVW